MKYLKNIVLISSILILLIICLVFLKLRKIEIPNNYNLLITMNFYSKPSTTTNYYFYDNDIIKYSKTTPALSVGVKVDTTTTKYSFKKKIDLSSLENVLNSYSHSEENSQSYIKIEYKNEKAYYINDNDAIKTLVSKIEEITKNSSKKRTYKKTYKSKIK